MAKHIAFKCNWNDGTQRSDAVYPGWSGICSSPLMKLNVTGPTKRPWCSKETCDCAKAMKGKAAFPRDTDEPCYESAIFGDKPSFSAGGQQILQTAPDKIAFLTSRHPSWKDETRRVIIGAYRVKKVGKDPRWPEQDSVLAVKSSVVRLHESQFLNYWDLVQRPKDGIPAWDTGLTRYLEDSDAATILRAMESIDVDTAQLDHESLATSTIPGRTQDPKVPPVTDAYRDKLLSAERAFFQRNARAAQSVRLRANGVCEACGGNVVKRYGADIIEAHHRRSFSSLPADTMTVATKDLAALCPSCHRALHRLSPSTTALLSVQEFAKTITTTVGGGD